MDYKLVTVALEQRLFVGRAHFLLRTDFNAQTSLSKKFMTEDAKQFLYNKFWAIAEEVLRESDLRKKHKELLALKLRYTPQGDVFLTHEEIVGVMGLLSRSHSCTVVTNAIEKLLPYCDKFIVY